MSYCINPQCANPVNSTDVKFCVTCGHKLLLKERYRAIKPIGQGGFGRTFLATDEDKPSRPLCVIKQQFFQSSNQEQLQKAIELFNQEAERLDDLGKHSQIPELLAYFTQNDRQYLVQEFIDGCNLEQELDQRGRLSENEVKKVLVELLPVVNFIHDKLVIHRDIKPENIIREKSTDKLVLVDFGAAKLLTGTALIKQGTTIGSPEYVSPEQARGQAIFASDIYSLGVTCLHLLTGISPFDLYDVGDDRWVWRDFLNTRVNDQFGQILDRMVEGIPSKRYQSALEIMKTLGITSPKSSNPSISIHSSPTTIPPKPVNKPINNPPQPNPIPSPPIPTPKVESPSNYQSLVDLELAEIRGQFTGQNPPSVINNSSSPKSSNLSPKNDIDGELEELRSEFLNKGNS
jgi:serine/threonine protein kinase